MRKGKVQRLGLREGSEERVSGELDKVSLSSQQVQKIGKRNSSYPR